MFIKSLRLQCTLLISIKTKYHKIHNKIDTEAMCLVLSFKRKYLMLLYCYLNQSYRSSTFVFFFLLQKLNSLKETPEVCDAIHASIFLILLGINISKQLNNVNILVLFRAFLLRWSPDKTKQHNSGNL